MKIIQTEAGALRGIPRTGVVEYRGVPYARAPEGPLRFRAPQPVRPWTGVRVAERAAPPAWQVLNPMMGVDHMGTDCLAMNLWVPEAGDGPLPVMVWLHGGGFTSGSASQLLYHGEALARQRQVIVVNVGYRLGAWGFAHVGPLLPALQADANLGLRDQIAALQWVQRNIAAFGGDPDRVTLFGESAGGFAVATLMASPAARGLFRQAVVQSGAADMVLAPAEALRVAEAWLAALPAEARQGDGLLHLPPEQLVRAQQQVMGLAVDRGAYGTTPVYGMPFLPVLDQELVPDLPVRALAQGAGRSVRLLAGACRDEYTLFCYAPGYSRGKSLQDLRQIEPEALLSRFRRTLLEQGDAALKLYQDTVAVDPRRGPLDWFAAMESDRLFKVPTQRLLDAQRQGGGEAWGYLFTWESTFMGVPLGSCHVVDVPFVFDLVETPVGRLFTGGGEGARQLARRVGDVWQALARGQAPDWEAWGGQDPHRFGPEGDRHQEQLLHPDRRAFWNAIIPAPQG